MKYLIDPMDLSVEEIDELIDIANDIIKIVPAIKMFVVIKF